MPIAGSRELGSHARSAKWSCCVKEKAQIFVGRQPILDRQQRVVAYELLFRASATADRAVFDQQQRASARVIVNTFGSMGADNVLGTHRGFFNVGAGVLMHDVIEALPSERAVIEVLEDVEATPEVVARCHELKSLGFTLALDDWVPGDARVPLLDLADVVKVDLPEVDAKSLARLVRRLRRRSLQILAEKVETRAEFDRCHDLGFDLFQGYFFARPVVIEGAALDPRRLGMLRLLEQINEEATSDELVDTLKHEVTLGVSLLRLVNCAALSTRNKIGSIADAVGYLGRDQLRRWLTILLYASDDGDAGRDPLLQTAAHRGRLMELVVEHALFERDGRKAEGQAFLVGMLSLVDARLWGPRAGERE